MLKTIFLDVDLCKFLQVACDTPRYHFAKSYFKSLVIPLGHFLSPLVIFLFSFKGTW